MESKYMKQHTAFQVIAADGTILNHGWGTEERAQQDADRYGEGAFVRRHDYELEVTASDRVLIDSGIPEEHWSLLRSDAHRMMNMARDAGRPSDCMRSSVRAFKSGTLTEASFAASRPSNYYPED